jgi:hypothetical protein
MELLEQWDAYTIHSAYYITKHTLPATLLRSTPQQGRYQCMVRIMSQAAETDPLLACHQWKIRYPHTLQRWSVSRGGNAYRKEDLELPRVQTAAKMTEGLVCSG